VGTIIGKPVQIEISEAVGANMRIYAQERNGKKVVSIEVGVEDRDFTAIVLIKNAAAVDRIIAALVQQKIAAFGE